MATVSVSVGSLIERATAQPKRFLVPHRLLVNHDGFGLGLGLHDHPPKGEREGDDRYD
jgi:hypothetical protein